MAMLRHLVLFASLYFILGLPSSAAKLGEGSCEEQMKEIDYLAKRVILMSPDRVIPRNLTTMEEWCSPLKTLAKQIGRYTSKCEKAFRKQIFGILGGSLKKPVRLVCKVKKQKSLESFSCMNNDFIQDLNKREAILLDSLYYIKENVTEEKLVPTFCCSVNRLVEGVKNDMVKPKCSASQSPNKFLYDLVNSAVGDILDLICGSFRTVKQCKERDPQTMAIMEQMTGKLGLDQPLIPVVADILGRIGD